MKNYEALLALFAKILGDTTERNRLNKDKRAQIGRLRLSIQMYSIIDKKAKKLQGDKVNISMSLDIVRTLVRELEQQRDNFDFFWRDVLKESNNLSELLNRNEILQNFHFSMVWKNLVTHDPNLKNWTLSTRIQLLRFIGKSYMFEDLIPLYWIYMIS